MSAAAKLSAVSADPKTTCELISPKVATAWLETNTHNRPVRQRHVEFLTNEIRNGAWKVTNQGIAFDYNGVLLDGQHRLWAIVYADKAVKMNVTRGLDPDAQDAIDINGAARSVGDMLTLGGDSKGKKRAEVINLIRLVVYHANGKKMGMQEARKIATSSFAEGIEWAISLPERSKCGTSTVRGCLAIAYKSNPSRVAEFAEQVWRGVGLKESDPAYVLRGILLGEITYSARAHFDRRAMSYKTLRAILAFLHEEPVRGLYATPDAVIPFAKAHGVDMKSARVEQNSLVRQIRAKVAKVKGKATK